MKHLMQLLYLRHRGKNMAKTKSAEFLDSIFNEIVHSYYESPVDTCSLYVQHTRNIFELIKQNRFGNLEEYLQNPIYRTPDADYMYSIRDKLSSELQAGFDFIQDIENE